jgi:hypothetical protein
MSAQKGGETQEAPITLLPMFAVGPRNFGLYEPCEIRNIYFLNKKKIYCNVP